MRARNLRRRVGAAGIGIAWLAACGGGTPVPQSPVLAAEEDISVPLGESDVPLAIDASSMKRSLRGSIASITTVPGAAGWYDVELAGDDTPATRILRVGTKARLPFTAGETLDVRWTQRQAGWDASNLDLELRDAQGALWAGVYTQLVDHEGWSFELLPAAEGIPCRVALTHQGRRAVIPTGVWRRFETQDGRWAATVECPSAPPAAPGSPSIPSPDDTPEPTVVQLSRLVRP